MAQLLECLPSKCKFLSSNPNKARIQHKIAWHPNKQNVINSQRKWKMLKLSEKKNFKADITEILHEIMVNFLKETEKETDILSIETEKIKRT